MIKWKCPKCESNNLRVVGLVTLRLTQTDDGNFETVPDEKNGDHEWTRDSTMSCQDCNFVGKAQHFEYHKPGKSRSSTSPSVLTLESRGSAGHET